MSRDAGGGGAGAAGAIVRSGAQGDETLDEADRSMTRLWENFLKASNLGHSSSDWRLALPTLATSLTLHLIDGELGCRNQAAG